MIEDPGQGAVCVPSGKESQDDARVFPMPLDIQRFLMGNGPLEGVWFGEDHPTRKGQFWWRDVIRERSERNP